MLFADKISELGPKVAAALGTRGGMRPGAFQGKVASLDRLPQALKVLHDSLAQSRRSLDNVVRDPWLSPLLCLCSPPVCTPREGSSGAFLTLCMPHWPSLAQFTMLCWADHPESIVRALSHGSPGCPDLS